MQTNLLQIFGQNFGAFPFVLVKETIKSLLY